MFNLNELLADSIYYLTNPVTADYNRCESCKSLLADTQTGQRDIESEEIRKCRDCRNGKKKKCDCGSWHMTGSSLCLECFIKLRKGKNK